MRDSTYLTKLNTNIGDAKPPQENVNRTGPGANSGRFHSLMKPYAYTQNTLDRILSLKSASGGNEDCLVFYV